MGGDEFIVVVFDVQKENMTQLIAKIFSQVKEVKILVDEGEPSKGRFGFLVTVGYAVRTSETIRKMILHSTSVSKVAAQLENQLRNEADAAMYEAKENKKKS